MTLQQMIDFCTPLTAQATGMSEAEARALMEKTLPSAKRWSGN
jgi:hypothetical protein